MSLKDVTLSDDIRKYSHRLCYYNEINNKLISKCSKIERMIIMNEQRDYSTLGSILKYGTTKGTYEWYRWLSIQIGGEPTKEQLL